MIDATQVTHTNGPDCDFAKLSTECKRELDAIERWQKSSAPPVLVRDFFEGEKAGAWKVQRTGRPPSIAVPDLDRARVVK